MVNQFQTNALAYLKTDLNDNSDYVRLPIEESLLKSLFIFCLINIYELADRRYNAILKLKRTC